KIILPGVGAFGDAMRELEKRELAKVLRSEAEKGKIILGICLGLQVFFERSEESPGVKGLGLLPGDVRRFVTNLKVPHMGWNELIMKKNPPLFRGIDDGAHVYFVHSYYVVPRNPEDIASTTDYGGEFVSSVWRGNLLATQFHPEKSQSVGLRMLKNFVDMETGNA
ncbi:imidazole glycerol phosphate synthase subunit HisH, partial [Candidatus Sumerlaeota bacterium]|nr:imidazole glycerol phosphate synthase subunit HisH [Candidatus Sumerlaeota bacterium]